METTLNVSRCIKLEAVAGWKPPVGLTLVKPPFFYATFVQVKVFERGTGEDDGPEVAFHNEKRMLQLLKLKTSLKTSHFF